MQIFSHQISFSSNTVAEQLKKALSERKIPSIEKAAAQSQLGGSDFETDGYYSLETLEETPILIETLIEGLTNGGYANYFIGNLLNHTEQLLYLFKRKNQS
jgi:hypothetical protein